MGTDMLMNNADSGRSKHPSARGLSRRSLLVLVLWFAVTTVTPANSSSDISTTPAVVQPAHESSSNESSLSRQFKYRRPGNQRRGYAWLIAATQRENIRENVMTQAQAMHHCRKRIDGEFAGFGATVREIVSALATEQTLALRASTKAALPRQNLTELRAMYTRLVPIEGYRSPLRASRRLTDALPSSRNACCPTQRGAASVDLASRLAVAIAAVLSATLRFPVARSAMFTALLRNGDHRPRHARSVLMPRRNG